MTSKKPVLITGSHRSGSTWVGRMIAASPSVGYIHEPFNLADKRGMRGYKYAKFHHWFTYICDENGSNYYEDFKKTLAFQYDIVEASKIIKNPKEAAQTLREYARSIVYRSRKARPLVKDPIALFSVKWLAKSFDMDVICLIRHPAAFVNSLMRTNWTFDFSNLLEQPLLMKDHLYPFENEMMEFAKNERDILDQGILLWKIIHTMILNYRNNLSDCIFIRHEDISYDPPNSFENLFDKLNLNYSDSVRKIIEQYSVIDGPSKGPEKKKPLKRDSRANILSWKMDLSESEINKIRNGVEEIAREFYSDEDW